MAGKKILILTNRVPYPLNDGGNLAMHAMINGYAKAGWQVYLLAMNTSRHYIKPEALKTIYTNIYAFDTVDVDNSIKVQGMLKNFLLSSLPNHAERFLSAAFNEKLLAVLGSFLPDVVQVESVFLSGYLPVIRFHSQAKTILRVHNIEYHIWDRLAQKTSNLLKRYYLTNLAKRMKRYEEAAWKRYDVLLPITQVDADAIKEAGVASKTIVVPFGINASGVYSQIADSEWNVYHMAAMDWQANRDAVNWFLEETWPLVFAKYPELKFYFAGRKMPEYFKKMDIAGVHCMGEVEDAEAFIADKKILVVPLRSGGGIRVKILEAMVAGKVVISTSIGMQGIDAVAGEHYLLADNPQEFANAIGWCIAHKQQAEQIALNGSILVTKKYNQEDIFAQLIKALDTLF